MELPAAHGILLLYVTTIKQFPEADESDSRPTWPIDYRAVH